MENNILRDSLAKHYTGNKLTFVGAGCGSYWAELLQIPGISRIVNAVLLPYEENLTKAMADMEWEKVSMVSKELVEGIYKNYFYEPENKETTLIVASAALCTNRQRKGEDHAYLLIGNINSYRVWHIVFKPLDAKVREHLKGNPLLESLEKMQRSFQDTAICNIVYAHLLGMNYEDSIIDSITLGGSGPLRNAG